MYAKDFSIADPSTTVAFSGHRRIAPPPQPALFGVGSASAEEHAAGITRKLEAALDKLIDGGYDTFLCGMAAGFDLMAGLAVCKMIEEGLPVHIHALVPYPGQAAAFTEGDRRAYGRILDMCRSVVTVCPAYRRDCFHLRNDLLVANSRILVCYYDGRPGETHYTVRQALRRGHRVVNLL